MYIKTSEIDYSVEETALRSFIVMKNTVKVSLIIEELFVFDSGIE